MTIFDTFYNAEQFNNADLRILIEELLGYHPNSRYRSYLLANQRFIRDQEMHKNFGCCSQIMDALEGVNVDSINQHDFYKNKDQMLKIIKLGRPSIDDYCRHISNTDLIQLLELESDKENLITLDSSMCLEDDMVVLYSSKKSTNFEEEWIKCMSHEGIEGIMREFSCYPVIFLHNFFQHSTNISILLDGLRGNCEVQVRIDPFRLSNGGKIYFNGRGGSGYGASFSEKGWFAKCSKERVNKHQTYLAEKDSIYLRYPVDYTVFRLLPTKDNFNQAQIEEYIPYEDQPYIIRNFCVTNLYVVQKFAHMNLDLDQRCFEHIDCGVRIFKLDEYKKVFDGIKGGKTPISKIGQRHKLFKVTGRLEFKQIITLLEAYFDDNKHIGEYFNIKKVKH